ncbi:nucleotidyltransferase domain-containing protein [Geoglobus acetivorans]|uniref:Nucleotidyltransferase domain-containing protein n=1 Tax=Geoglobus acetivorans TaxID=565033 RepID=A0ABZ3H3Y1_GEOAI|nr:nucleotidyltransferase domain-containing protein [Geoglobus acetivorans]
MNKEKAPDSFTRRIETFRDVIVRVIVFGSYARGEAKEESDIYVHIIRHFDLFY